MSLSLELLLELLDAGLEFLDLLLKLIDQGLLVLQLGCGDEGDEGGRQNRVRARGGTKGYLEMRHAK